MVNRIVYGSDEVQDASLRIEMGNIGLQQMLAYKAGIVETYREKYTAK